MKLLILLSIIVLVLADDFKEKWRWSPNHPDSCMITTKSNPVNKFQQFWTTIGMGADPRCDQNMISFLERLCLERFVSETNQYDLTQPINGHGHPKIYGQMACEKFGVDMDTTLVLQVSYKCTGSNSNADHMVVSYDILERKGVAIKIKCQGGKYVAP